MKTITKTYNIYEFKELSEEIQKEILALALRNKAKKILACQLMPTADDLKAVEKRVKIEAHDKTYFKDGQIAIIPENVE